MATQGDTNILASKPFDPVTLGEFIRSRYDNDERQFVTFLIGAGFSCSAGVPSAGQIVWELREQEKNHPLLRGAGPAPEGVSEYAHLMEKLGSPSERARWVKRFVDRARQTEGPKRLKINWAHLLLASMVDKGLVKRILTTNFDPLIVEALALTGQPIRTYDLNTTGHYSPGTLDSGSIIYLHGQMHSLFLANSPEEMERVSKLYPGVLQDAIQGSLLIVVGYSGECDPVLGSLEKLPSFPDGLWWSHFSTKNRPPCADVVQLFNQHSNSCHISSGDDADNFMRKLVLDGIKLELPGVVLEPFKTADDMLGRITQFPSADRIGAEGDPVTASRALLKQAQVDSERPVASGQTEEVATQAEAVPSKSEGRKNLSELKETVVAQMASMISDEASLKELADEIPKNPTSTASQAIGDAYCRLASKSFSAGKFSDGHNYLSKSAEFGVSENLRSWVPVLEGNALLEQAKLKGSTAEGDALLAEAGKKYAEAVRIKPDMLEAYSNWGAALSDQAKLKGDTAEGDALFAEAGKKYAEAVRIKPDDCEVYYNWGNALSDQAKLKGSTAEGDALFAEAGKKYAEAVRIKPDMYEANYNWGIALSDQAKLKGGTAEGDALLVEAGRKYAEAVRIKPDNCDAYYNWGNALLEQARLKGDTAEGDALLVEAGKKYAEAVRIKPDMHEAYSNWGAALSDQARLKGDTAEGDALFAEAGKKYAEAVRIKPDMYEAYYNWGIALSDQAKLKGSTAEGDALLVEAGKKYAEAVRIKPDKHEAYNNWGNALSDQAKLKGDTAEGDALFAEAGKKYAEAVRIKPDMHEAYYNWGNALLEQARLKGDTAEGDALLAEAGGKYAEAVRIKPDAESTYFNLGCLHVLRGDVKKCCESLMLWKKYHPHPTKQKLDSDSDFDKVRGTPEFQAFRNSLPE